ncbi:MAG: helix-turn-helix domain-containing protein [Phycisphaeraceae bacterium]|nr:helix-turn-helix domain-containing protein [Phycisphaeraceae bacterium]
MAVQESSDTLITWPRLALGVIAQAELNTDVVPNIPTWNFKPIQEINSNQQRYSTGMHHHDVLELCVTVQGQGIMDIQGQRYEMIQPAMVVLAPGLEHCEGIDHHKHSYATIWFTWTASANVRIFVNAYQPNVGWSIPWGTVLPTRYQHHLSKWTNGLPDISAFELLRATLLAALGELAYQSQLQSKKNPKKAAAGHIRVLQWVRHYIDQHYAQPLSVDSIALMTCYSPHYLNTLFTRWIGRGIRTYLIDQRMLQAQRLCQYTKLPIHDIATRVGYDDPLYFSRAYRKYHGCAPTQSRAIET